VALYICCITCVFLDFSIILYHGREQVYVYPNNLSHPPHSPPLFFSFSPSFRPAYISPSPSQPHSLSIYFSFIPLLYLPSSPSVPLSLSPSLPLSLSLYYQSPFSPSMSPSLFHSLTLPLCATLWLFSTLSLYKLLPHSRHPSLSTCLPISPLICHPLSLSHTH
jgi:hypothetical protein